MKSLQARGHSPHRGCVESIDRLNAASNHGCVGTRGAADFVWEECTMKTTAAPVRFAGSQLGEARHVCALFNSDDEEYRVLLPFIKDGFECGDKAVHVVNPDQHSSHLQRLAAAGIDLAAVRQSGQFELRTNTDTYLRDG